MTAQAATKSPGWARQRDALVHALRAFLPADALVTETETLRPHECDNLSALAAALPQVQATASIAARA